MTDFVLTDAGGVETFRGVSRGGAGVMRWQAFKTLTAAEWNAGVVAGTIDVATLPTGAILYDATARPSPTFNDSFGSSGKFGWDLAGTPRHFGANVDIQPAVDDWAGVAGSSTPKVQSVLALSGGTTVPEYGPPAFIKDAAVAGPLQFSPNANGDATLGTVTFWLYTDAGAP